MKHVLALAAGVALSAAAVAEPFGTQLSMTVSHTGPFGEVQNFTHVYGGGAQQIFDSFGFSYLVISAVQVSGYQNAIQLDFNAFAYTDFAGETGTVQVGGFAVGVANASLLNGNFAAMGSTISTASSINGTWAVNDVIATGNLMYIAWNKVPTPGATALFGLAGLAGLRRRR